VTGYPRSTGSSRGTARRRDLLDRVSQDLAVNGLVDFSLRRAAKAAGTTHKVLLYHFDSVEELLEQAILRLREQRISNALVAATLAEHESLADRVRAIWPILRDAESGLRVLDQAIGLSMYDPARYGALGREASRQYLPGLLSIMPPRWSPQRQLEVAELILAAMRGFLVHWLTSGDDEGAEAGLAALVRALEREEDAVG
jgi:AcrR family transcriptional regulator